MNSINSRKKVAWSVQNECFFRRRWFVASTLGHQREFWGNNGANRPKKRKKLCQWMTSGVRFNKLLFGTFLNGYGGAAGCLFVRFCMPHKKWCLQSDLGKDKSLQVHFGIFMLTRIRANAFYFRKNCLDRFVRNIFAKLAIPLSELCLKSVEVCIGFSSTFLSANASSSICFLP